MPAGTLPPRAWRSCIAPPREPRRRAQYFELPWPDAPPVHAQLKMFVRVVTADGTKLEADRDLVVDLTGSAADTRRAPGARATSGIVPAAGGSRRRSRLNWGRTPAAEALDVPGALPALVEQEAAPIPTTVSSEPVGPLLFPASELQREHPSRTPRDFLNARGRFFRS